MKTKLLKYLSYLLLISPAVVGAKSINMNEVANLPAAWRLNFELVDMPDHGERKMGFLGINYLIDLQNWLYAGVAGYGAVTGERGGLFTLGVETGMKLAIFPDIFVDGGIYAGGGGGKTSLVGGGLMLRPHVGAAYGFEYFKVGVDASKVYFPDGSINSNQIAFNLEIPTEITYAAPPRDHRLDHVIYTDNKAEPYFDFNKYYLSALGQVYLQSNSTDDLGNNDSSTLQLVGIEAGRFFSPFWFGFIKAAGAFAGNHNGYMDVLGGVGGHYAIPAMPQVAVNGRMAVGMGGGGNVDTGGGLLLEPSIGLQYQFMPSLSAELAGGFLGAPDGKFHAYTITGKVSYAMLLGDTETQPTKAHFIEEYYLQSWRVNLFNQTYFNPQRKSGETNSNHSVNLVGIKIDDFVASNLYLSGQAASAYAGKAGGYSSGMLGVGWLTDPFFAERMNASAEVLFGAGGGGGLNVSGGAIVNPVLGLHYNFSRYIAASATAGRIMSVGGGKLNATTLTAGLTFKFATINGQEKSN